VKKTAVIFALIVLSMVIFLPLAFTGQAAHAQATGYSIQQVIQTVQILFSGHTVISENILLSGQLPSTFELGLPFKYGTSILDASAYDSNYNVLPIALGVQLGSQSGFYGAEVTLPSGTSDNFTVVFILSNAVLSIGPTSYNLDYPAYLAFTQSVGTYTTNMVLPNGTSIVGIDKPDGVINATTYSTSNLAAFTYAPATASITVPTGDLEQVNILSLDRQISISPSGGVSCTDTYKIVDNSTLGIGAFQINLPGDALNVVARDQFGAVLSTSLLESSSQVLLENVTLALSLNPGDSTTMSFYYSLPSVSHGQFTKYVLTLDLFAYYNYYIDSATVTITPPEGATFITPTLSQIGPSGDLSRNAFQESLTFNKQGVSYVDSTIPSENIVLVTFDYNALWIAFRPTIWMWVAAVLGVVVVAVWKRPKIKETASGVAVVKMGPGAALSPESLKDFVEAYEEKGKVSKELRALEARAQHGRIPRRRYKVQRRTLELRLDTLSHRIAQLKEVLRSAGGSYVDSVRQIEAAEVELNEVELNLQSIEVRHESGEITLEVYKKQLTDMERRREKAQASLDGLLLRLRGEIR
jgi:hypothetical protein